MSLFTSPKEPEPDINLEDEDYYYLDPEDDATALEKAARAGILLLEKNQELLDENNALRQQVEILNQQQLTLQGQLNAQEVEIHALRKLRSENLTEVNTLQWQIKDMELILKQSQVLRIETTNQQQIIQDLQREIELLRYNASLSSLVPRSNSAKSVLQDDDSLVIVSLEDIEKNEYIPTSNDSIIHEIQEIDLSNMVDISILESIQMENTNYKTELEQLKTQHTQWKIERKDLKKRLEEVQTQLKYEQLRKQELKAEIQEYHVEINETKQLLESLKSTNEQLEAALTTTTSSNETNEIISICNCSKDLEPKSNMSIQQDLFDANKYLEEEVYTLRLSLSEVNTKLQEATRSDRSNTILTSDTCDSCPSDYPSSSQLSRLLSYEKEYVKKLKLKLAKTEQELRHTQVKLSLTKVSEHAALERNKWLQMYPVYA